MHSARKQQTKPNQHQPLSRHQSASGRRSWQKKRTCEARTQAVCRGRRRTQRTHTISAYRQQNQSHTRRTTRENEKKRKKKKKMQQNYKKHIRRGRTAFRISECNARLTSILALLDGFLNEMPPNRLFFGFFTSTSPVGSAASALPDGASADTPTSGTWQSSQKKQKGEACERSKGGVASSCLVTIHTKGLSLS